MYIYLYIYIPCQNTTPYTWLKKSMSLVLSLQGLATSNVTFGEKAAHFFIKPAQTSDSYIFLLPDHRRTGC